MANAQPEWFGKYVAFPKHAKDYYLEESTKDSKVKRRAQIFSDGREPGFYTEEYRSAKLIHFQGILLYRLLHHQYGNNNKHIFQNFHIIFFSFTYFHIIYSIDFLC